MRPPRFKDLEFGTELQRKLPLAYPGHLLLRRWPIVGLLATLLGIAGSSLDVFTYLREFRQSAMSARQSDKPLYDVPIIKGLRSTLGSLKPKHQDSLPYLEDVLRLRSSNDPATARFLIEKVLEYERPTASDELLSHLYSLRGDLLTQEGKSAEAIQILKQACKLNPRSWEMPFLLLEAYKAERSRLEASPTPWPEELDKRIQSLGKKIRELEESLYPDLLSVLERLEEGSEIELVAGSYSVFVGGSGLVPASCNTDTGPDPCFAGSLHGTGSGDFAWNNGGAIICGCNNNGSPTANGCTGMMNLACGTSAGIFLAPHGKVSSTSGAMFHRYSSGNTFGLRAGRVTFNSYDPASSLPAAGETTCEVGRPGCRNDNLLGLSHENLVTFWDRGASKPTLAACERAGTHITPVSNCAFAGLDRHEATGAGRNQVLAVGVNGGAIAGFDRVERATADALRVSDALRNLDFRSTVLLNHEATKPKVLIELAHAVQTSRPGDLFVFYFSGHGFTDANGHPVLVTGRSKPVVVAGGPAGGAFAQGFKTDGLVHMLGGADQMPVNAYNQTEILFLEEVVDMLSYHRGRAVVILDNCLNTMELDGGSPRRMAAGPNRPTIILAGEPGSRVIESPRLGSGLFTYTLLRFLDQQRTPELDFNEMFRYTAAETARLARNLYGMSQRPQWLLVR